MWYYKLSKSKWDSAAKANDVFGHLTPIACETQEVIIPDLTELAAEDVNLLCTELHSGSNI